MNGELTLKAGLRMGLRLEAISIAWMIIEASVSVRAGIIAGSLLLVAFGVDSIIELISACLLFWRLRQEAAGRLPNEEAVEALEQKTSRVAGYLLYGLSLYVVVQAVYGLTHRHQAEISWPGIVVASAAAFGMPPLARAKIRVADRIGSRALRADAMETFTCGYLSWALLAGLTANAVLHWWWLDSAAALAAVPLLLKEAREAVTGECHCHDDKFESEQSKINEPSNFHEAKRTTEFCAVPAVPLVCVAESGAAGDGAGGVPHG